MSHRDNFIKTNKELSKPLDIFNIGFMGALGSEPDAPAIGTAVDNGNGTITANWSAATPNGSAVTAYKIYANGTLITTLENVLSYVHTITLGNSYYYNVEATNLHGYGELSANSNTVTTVAPISYTGSSVIDTANSGGYRYLEFLENGTITFPSSKTIKALVVGGGGGGHGSLAGGGGAGEVMLTNDFTVSAGTYDIVIGTGGNSSPTNGTNTTFRGITAIGGGRSGTYEGGSGNVNGKPGGSGGGASGYYGNGIGGSYGASGGFGSASGTSYRNSGGGKNLWYGGGGGGAGGAGGNAGGGGGAGGVGITISSFPITYIYGGGGGGAGYHTSNGAGGTGGGSGGGWGGSRTYGSGGRSTGMTGGNAGANTGSGSGGGTGGSGGSGIVIIRWAV
jgi:fibronectin-binding autotransporter adhesin